jgi:L-2-amino-thiazoline-4-carboxylic acid hydrolase-like protein
MSGAMRPNRVQPEICRASVAAELGPDVAVAVMRETGIADLPELLPSGPRDLEALQAELQPFVDLYRAVLARAGRDVALVVARRAIVDSGIASHAASTETQERAVAVPDAPRDTNEPLNLTSPPPPGFRAEPDQIQKGFDLAMRFFSCEGRLLSYAPDEVRFHVTGCNWVRAMQRSDAPELIPFFCETDERFMDHHPTHRLVRPTAIGLGDTHCDFQFLPIGVPAKDPVE